MRRNGPYSEYVLKEVSGGATRQKLSHWRKIGLLPRWSKGPLRGYGFTDLLSAKVIIKLKKAGISIRLIKKSLDAIKEREGIYNPLIEKRLFALGGKIYYLENDIIYEALSGQSTFFKKGNDEKELRVKLIELYNSADEDIKIKSVKRSMK